MSAVELWRDDHLMEQCMGISFMHLVALTPVHRRSENTNEGLPLPPSLQFAPRPYRSPPSVDAARTQTRGPRSRPALSAADAPLFLLRIKPTHRRDSPAINGKADVRR
ncbi:hypothetical protein B0H17DRAFT_1040857 [Mycena rosella]|uniref:Uncharacterized protein n=1 Tax=Mycena rosella TaxID=1033263 RepID=A0AAD7GRH8_MYCRO|nr:hypothetical protein B0H17DRAFT_1040857 [Mycena rosella]